MDILSRFSKRSNRNARTIKDLKLYLSQRYDLLKLELLEKSSKILTVILSMLVVLVCTLAALIYFSFALITWLSKLFNSEAPAYLIVCGIFILIMVIVLACKDKIFLNPLIKKLGEILYDQDDTKTKPSETEGPIDNDVQEGGSDE